MARIFRLNESNLPYKEAYTVYVAANGKVTVRAIKGRSDCGICATAKKAMWLRGLSFNVCRRHRALFHNGSTIRRGYRLLEEGFPPAPRDKERIDHAYYPGCVCCKAKTGESHFVGCAYKGPTEQEILSHYIAIGKGGSR